jgi:hypothetical protein
MPANPSNPVPSIATVEGSGTDPTMVVSPPEIMVDPLKKFLPVLIVN